MSSSPKGVKNLSKSMKMTLYLPDGSGRDCYISSNNAGFYKEYRIINSDPYKKREPIFYHNNYGNPICERPIKRYVCDGLGRDTYIFLGNARNSNSPKAGVDLQDILRTEVPPQKNLKFSPIGKSRVDISAHYANQRVGRNVTNRLFYGKANGLSERRLSPKVKFAKKRDYNDYSDYSYGRYERFETEPCSSSKGNKMLQSDRTFFFNGIRTLNNYKSKYHHY